MKLSSALSLMAFLISSAINGQSQSYSGIDGNGRFHHGRIDDSGSYSGIDGNGRFYHGRISENGSYSGIDGNGKFYYGRIGR